jgi:hypothetical protein
MPLTNAERQARWRDKRNALARETALVHGKSLEDARQQVESLHNLLKHVLARLDDMPEDLRATIEEALRDTSVPNEPPAAVAPTGSRARATEPDNEPPAAAPMPAGAGATGNLEWVGDETTGYAARALFENRYPITFTVVRTGDQFEMKVDGRGLVHEGRAVDPAPTSSEAKEKCERAWERVRS